MSGTRVWTRLSGPAVAAPDHPAMPSARHPRVQRLLRAMIDAALVAVLAAILFIGAGLVGNPWYRLVTIEGGSMAPTILRGDLIVVAPAPSKVEPGMILVMTAGGQVVTHRVVAVNADGTFVTRGDANSVNDAWGGQQVKVDGEYVATIPWLGHILPVGNASEASFGDAVGAGMHITVGPFPPPTSPVPATVRIVPQTINLTAKGDVTAFVDGLTAPSALSDIDLSSVTLCYDGACIPSDAHATLDGKAHVTATFTRSALAGLIGTDRGDLVLVVQGKLNGGGTFSGQDTNRVTGGSDATSGTTGGVAPDAISAATPTPTPDVTATPTPTP